MGSGKMGRHHLTAIAAAGVGVVVGVADPAADADELTPLLPPGAVVVPTLAELVARARPHVVHIVTPPSTHARLALETLEAGCHVYVEKPFTPTLEEARRIFDAARARDLLVCAGHQVLFEAPALRASEQLDQIGRLVHVESYFSFKMVRRTITPVEQVHDILPHAVYPLVEQLRRGTNLPDDPIAVSGVSLDASGEVYALLRLGSATGILVVTLNGRPVEQYQHIVGTNGALRADFIGGFLSALIGPGTGPGVLLTPYRRAFQTLGGATRGIVKLLRGGSYPGLRTLVQRFHQSVRDGLPAPIDERSILDTVGICEQLGGALDAAQEHDERRAQQRLMHAERALAPPRPGAPRVLVTGGTGMLGTCVAEELRRAGFPVRVVARRVPLHARRVPGVEYVPGDLARGLEAGTFADVGLVVHAAAETAGGRAEHRRNSVEATRRLIDAAAQAGIRRVVHVSSLAVLRPSGGRLLDESSPIDAGNLARGAYVWGKAESEAIVQQRARELGVGVRVVRLGPLVDFGAFQPPGRLGREVGPLFVGVGPRTAPLSVCDVSTAARVLRSFVDDFEAAPPVLNLVEAPAPSRLDLMNRYRVTRPDLWVIWCPGWLLNALGALLKLVQRVALGVKEPLDVAAAFASERYDTSLAAQIIERAGESVGDRHGERAPSSTLVGQ